MQEPQLIHADVGRAAENNLDGSPVYIRHQSAYIPSRRAI